MVLALSEGALGWGAPAHSAGAVRGPQREAVLLEKVQLQLQQPVEQPGQQLRGQAVKAPVGALALAEQAPVLPKPVLLLPEVPPPVALLSSPGLLLLTEDDPPMPLGTAPLPNPLRLVVVPLLQRLTQAQSSPSPAVSW